MLTVVDRHKVHTSVVTFIEDQLSATYRATWCRCLLFLWYMEIEVEDFPSHRHHLRVSFVNNTILDINYGAVCRCRRSACNSQTHMSFYILRIWRWNITFDPQASIENIGNCVDNRNFVRKKIHSALSTPNNAKLCALDAEFCINDNQRVQSLYCGVYHYPSQVQYRNRFLFFPEALTRTGQIHN